MNSFSFYRNRAMISMLAVLLAALACGAPFSDIPFHVVATYRAKVSGYQIDLETQGIVPAGADVSDKGTAQVQITPISPGLNTPLKIEIAPTGAATGAIGDGAKKDLNWFSHPQDELHGLLELAGYQDLSTDEINETVGVIGGAMAGSKGVVMDGQTKWLEVIDVQIQH